MFVRAHPASFLYLFVNYYGNHRDLHSFPTRRSSDLRPPGREAEAAQERPRAGRRLHVFAGRVRLREAHPSELPERARDRSEEHTSELQSRENLVCRLLLEIKKKESHLMKTSTREPPT